MFKPKRILVPMDFSDEAMLALDWAVMLAKQSDGATLFPAYIASVIPDAVALDVGKTAYQEVTRQWVDEKMQNLKINLSKTVPCEALFATGRPAEELADMCRLQRIDLVVMTTHGRQRISHLLHPSVAEELVRSAPCPVLVLHMNRLMVESVHELKR